MTEASPSPIEEPQKKENGLHEMFMRFLLWREKHVNDRTFILFVAFLVGIFGGLAAIVLKVAIHFISTALTSRVNISVGNYVYIILPAIGVVLSALFVRYVVKDNISHGVTRVLYAISQNKSRLKRHNIWTSVVASSVTIGFGGSVGAEGPIVFTGAAIGSNIGQLFRMSPRTLMILVGCGAAAGIAGIFKAPIAGMLFTLEVLMLDLTAVSVMPLLIASITSATMAYMYTGYDFEFFFIQSEEFYMAKIPYVVLLGVFCGLVSLYFTRAMNMMENFFHRFKNPWTKTLIGCLILSALVFIFPPLYGEGYGPQSGVVYHTLYRPYHPYQGFCNVCHKRRRWCWRYIRPVAIRRLYGRLPFCIRCQSDRFRHGALDKELRSHRHGRSDERGDACAAHGHILDRRTHWRLRSFSAAAHRVLRHH